MSVFACPSDGAGNMKTPAIPLFAANYLAMMSGTMDAHAWNNALSAVAAGHVPHGHPDENLRHHRRDEQLARGRRIPDGVDNKDVRGFIYTNRAGGQFVYATYTPNTTILGQLAEYYPDSANDGDFLARRRTTSRPKIYPASPTTATGFGGDNNVASRSRHSGGVNVVFADGHVAFIANSIHLATWQNLAWIADGNAVGSY